MEPNYALWSIIATIAAAIITPVVDYLIRNKIGSLWKYLLFAIGIGLFVFLIVFFRNNSVSIHPNTSTLTSTQTTIPMPMPSSTPKLTPIPRGEGKMSINFDYQGTGLCDYNPKTLGYEDGKYFIKPSSQGLIGICYDNTWKSQGSLEVRAYVVGDTTSRYGYGLLFGRDGSEVMTTDACIFGIQTETDAIQASKKTIKAIFTERIDGESETETIPVDIDFDDKPHTLRMILNQNGSAVGYLDEKYVASYQFKDCHTGPVGLVAWGSGDTTVYFDDFRLYALP